MATKRKRSKKKKTKSQPKEKKQSRLNQLKITQDSLYSRVQDNLQTVIRNTGMTTEELGSFIRNNGYDGLKKLPNLDIAEPILNRMIMIFKQYDELGILITRRQALEDKLLVASIKKETQQLEAEVQAIEEQEKFYTELPDKAGFVHMRDKYFAEKEHWDLLKAQAEEILAENPQHIAALTQYEEAEKQLKLLSKKRNWARMKNIQPNIVKWTGKITGAINTVQDSMGEISKPFQEAGKTGTSQSGGNDFANMFTPEKIFGKKGKKQESYF